MSNEFKRIQIEMNRRLVEAFPELMNAYNDEIRWQEGEETGCHVVYGDVLSPYLEKMLCEKNTEQLVRLFAFIEDLLEINDKYIDEVIMLSVLGFIIDDSEKRIMARLFMGPLTQKRVDKFINNLGREKLGD